MPRPAHESQHKVSGAALERFGTYLSGNSSCSVGVQAQIEVQMPRAAYQVWHLQRGPGTVRLSQELGAMRACQKQMSLLLLIGMAIQLQMA